MSATTQNLSAFRIQCVQLFCNALSLTAVFCVLIGPFLNEYPGVLTLQNEVWKDALADGKHFVSLPYVPMEYRLRWSRSISLDNDSKSEDSSHFIKERLLGISYADVEIVGERLRSSASDYRDRSFAVYDCCDPSRIGCGDLERMDSLRLNRWNSMHVPVLVMLVAHRTLDSDVPSATSLYRAVSYHM